MARETLGTCEVCGGPVETLENGIRIGARTGDLENWPIFLHKGECFERYKGSLPGGQLPPLT